MTNQVRETGERQDVSQTVQINHYNIRNNDYSIAFKNQSFCRRSIFETQIPLLSPVNPAMIMAVKSLLADSYTDWHRRITSR